jgi:hypothetical protein
VRVAEAAAAVGVVEVGVVEVGKVDERGSLRSSRQGWKESVPTRPAELPAEQQRSPSPAPELAPSAARMTSLLARHCYSTGSRPSRDGSGADWAQKAIGCPRLSDLGEMEEH